MPKTMACHSPLALKRHFGVVVLAVRRQRNCRKLAFLLVAEGLEVVVRRQRLEWEVAAVVRRLRLECGAQVERLRHRPQLEVAEEWRLECEAEAEVERLRHRPQLEVAEGWRL